MCKQWEYHHASGHDACKARQNNTPNNTQPNPTDQNNPNTSADNSNAETPAPSGNLEMMPDLFSYGGLFSIEE